MKRFLCFIIALSIITVLVGCEQKKQGIIKYDPVNYSKKSNLKILALGNSFYGSSTVMEWFKNLCMENNKNDVEADSMSKGYYTISLYYNDIFKDKQSQQEYKNLREGYYDVLILSTLYVEEDIPAIGDFCEALKETKTKIILFPAENESKDSIPQAVKKYDIICANWLSLIARLKFRHGFKNSHLNIADTHKHSNTISGFAGACLLYSRLFDEIPDIDDAKESILDSYYDLVPGETAADKAEKLDVIATEAYDIMKTLDEEYSGYRNK